MTSEIGRSMQTSAEKVGEMSNSVQGIDSLVSNTGEKTQDLNSVANKLKELSVVS